MPGIIKKFIKTILVAMIAVLFVTGFFVFEKKGVEAQSDAIAVQVLANPQHYSPLTWYKSKGFTGNPTPLTVDGYQAIQDGRTVYVNVANVLGKCSDSSLNCSIDSDCGGGTCNASLYTNIYLISYTDTASADTISIFNKILANWKFNTNLTDPGVCFNRPADDSACHTDADCPNKYTCNRGACMQYCLGDADCSGGFCGSLKARVTRDIKRLGDITDLKAQIDAYRHKLGHNPLLASGTYIPGETVSSWPSWNGEFGTELGTKPPADPINKFLDGCGDPKFDPLTCWDDKDKVFAGSIPGNMPSRSRVLAYSTDAQGRNYNVCGEMESGLYVVDPNGDFSGDYCPGSYSPNPVPVISCGTLTGAQNQPFSGFITVSDPINNPIFFTIANLPSGFTAKTTSDPHKLEIDSANAANSGTFPIDVAYKSNTTRGQLSQTCQINISSQARIIYPLADQKVVIGKTLNFSVFAYNSAKNYDGLNFYFDVRPDNIMMQCKTPLTITADGRARCDVTISGYSVSVPGQYTIEVSARSSSCPTGPAPFVPVTPGVLNQPIFNFMNSVAVDGKYAYVVNWAGNSLLIADISNPAAPRAVGQISNGDGGALLHNPGSVFVSGDYAYVASHGDNALEIINIKNKNNPVHAGSLSGLRGALGISVVGDHAYVADWEGGDFSVVDVSDKTNPVLQTSLPIVQPYSLITDNGYAYVTRRNGGAYALQIVDLSDPANPTLIGGATDPSLNQPLASAISDHYAFTNDWHNSTIVAVDVANKSAPSVVSSLAIAGKPYSVVISGKYAYLPLYSGNALQIVDISDPANMTPVGIIHNGDGGAHLTNPVSVRVSGNYAFVASQGDNTLEVIDITDPTNPVHYGSLTNEAVASSDQADYHIAGNISSADSGYTIAADATAPQCGEYTVQQFNLNITNNPPVVQPINCDKSTRDNVEYMPKTHGCQITAIDAEDPLATLIFSADSLPPGLSLTSNTSGAIISGTPTSPQAAPYNITITVTDPHGSVSKPVILPLQVNTFCGDGVQQAPNYEGKGGHSNDGYEDCDCGNYPNYLACAAASAISHAPSFSQATASWQYGCNANCTSANGGFCGDGIVQDGLLSTRGGQEVINGVSLKHAAGNFGEQCDFGKGVNTGCCNDSTCQYLTGPYVSTAVTASADPVNGFKLSLPPNRGVQTVSFTAHPDITGDDFSQYPIAIMIASDISNPPQGDTTINNMKAGVNSTIESLYNNLSVGKKETVLVGAFGFGGGTADSVDSHFHYEVAPQDIADASFRVTTLENQINFYKSLGDEAPTPPATSDSRSSIDLAIPHAQAMLDSLPSNYHKFMIILTDGCSCQVDSDVTNAANAAKAAAEGIKIYTISYSDPTKLASAGWKTLMCGWSSDNGDASKCYSNVPTTQHYAYTASSDGSDMSGVLAGIETDIERGIPQQFNVSAIVSGTGGGTVKSPDLSVLPGSVVTVPLTITSIFGCGLDGFGCDKNLYLKPTFSGSGDVGIDAISVGLLPTCQP